MKTFNHFPPLTLGGPLASSYFLAQTGCSAIAVVTQGSTCMPGAGCVVWVTVEQSSAVLVMLPSPQLPTLRLLLSPTAQQHRAATRSRGTGPTHSRVWEGVGNRPCHCGLFITLQHQAHKTREKNVHSQTHTLSSQKTDSIYLEGSWSNSPSLKEESDYQSILMAFQKTQLPLRDACGKTEQI